MMLPWQNGAEAKPSGLMRFSDMLGEVGAALNPKIGAMVADRDQKQLQQALIMGQLSQMQQQQARQQMVQSALANFKGDPQQLLGVLATIDSETFAPTYLKEMGEQVTTSPTGASANFGAPSASGALPPAQGTPQAPVPTGQPALQPLYKGGKPFTEGLPTGQQWAQDPQGQRIAMPIPGAVTKETIEQKELEAKKKESIESAKNKAEIIVDKVDKALGLIDPESDLFSSETGFIGSKLKEYGGTDAYNLEKTIDTIRANLGFEELRKMREASPTGGALGQVAVRELDMLQSTLSSLDIGQDRGQLIENLEAVKNHYNKWLETVGGNKGKEADTKEPAAKNSAIKEGTTATNPQTGEKIIFKNGAWGPM